MSSDATHVGSTTGYRNGCREACCRKAVAEATARQRKERYLLRVDMLRVPNLGTRRRIQALVALGWSLRRISEEAGYDKSHAALVLRREGLLRRTTVARFAEVYDRLSMQLPPETTGPEKVAASIARRVAAERGWVPPLAWENIDDPNEKPSGHKVCAKDDCQGAVLAKGLCSTHYSHQAGAGPTARTDVDDVAVDRILGGEWDLPCTPAEKREVCRRFVADGRTLRELERLTGWNTARYYTITEDAA